MSCNEIRVYLDEFERLFPYFNGKVTEDSLLSAYEGAKAFISTKFGTIELPKKLQVRGVYLATAHAMYLQLNPDIVANGKVTSATEGSVSASFATPAYKGWFDYYLSMTPYGIELLSILSQVQPPMPDKPCGIYPYYGVGLARRW